MTIILTKDIQINFTEMTDTDLVALQNEVAKEFKRRRCELRKEAKEELNAFIRKWEAIGITFETQWYDLKVDEFKIYDCDDEEEED